MIYLCSPYSHKSAAIRASRYAAAVKFVGAMMQRSLPVFSPIAYAHPYVVPFSLRTDAKYWHEFNMPFLRRADAVFVLQLAGWQESAGVAVEISLARQLCIPIIHYDADFNPLLDEQPSLADYTRQ